jgi:hypothetical protein
MDNKKPGRPRWFKWLFWLSVGPISFVFVVALGVALTQTAPEISSWDQWETHREYLKSFSNDVMIYKDAGRIYLHANDYYKDGFYNRCQLDACSEYKAFIRTARDSASDGLLTPKELTEIAEYKVRLTAVIAVKDKEFKAKFKK